jgi:hypothetical protein
MAMIRFQFHFELNFVDKPHVPASRKSAARSPIIVTGAWVLQVGMIGMTDASAIVSPSIPRTLNLASTTDMSSRPIAQVPQTWKNVEQASRM